MGAVPEGGPPSDVRYDGPTDTSDEAPEFAPTGLLGIGFVGTGALALWHGVSMQPADGADPAAARRSRIMWCSVGGARNYCAIRSYISTMRKHDADILDGLRSLFEGSQGLATRGHPNTYGGRCCLMS